MMDIWGGKSSMRRTGDRTGVLHSLTHSPIPNSVPEPFHERNFDNYVGERPLSSSEMG